MLRHWYSAEGLFVAMQEMGMHPTGDQRNFFDRINRSYMIFIYPDHPWPRPILQGLIATSLLPRSTMTMCSRQGRTPGPDPGPDRDERHCTSMRTCRARAGRVVKRDSLSRRCRARAGRAGLFILSENLFWLDFSLENRTTCLNLAPLRSAIGRVVD